MYVPCPRRPEDNSLELLGNEPGSSAKTASALKHLTVSSAPGLFIRGKAWVKSHKWRTEKNLGVILCVHHVGPGIKLKSPILVAVAFIC